MASKNAGGEPRNEARTDPSLAADPSLVATEIDQSPAPDPSLAALERIGIRELRNQVAAMVRRAANGERIIVTVEGEPMAQLGPLTPIRGATLDDLFASGLARAPRRADHPIAPEPVQPPVDTGFRSSIDALRGGA